MEQDSGIGVLDKAVAILDAMSSEPASLGELVARTGLPRATVHRLAVGLEHHGLARRDPAGRFRLGPRMAPPDPLPAVAAPALRRLRDDTGESAQLYVRRGDVRMCVAAAERPAGLRDTVPVGSTLPMTAGSAAKVLLAFGEEGFSSAPAPVEQGASVPGGFGRVPGGFASERQGDPAGAQPGPDAPARPGFDAGALARVRRQGWAVSIGERESGLASVSAPVRGPAGLLAAVSISGPARRFGRAPGQRFGPRVVLAASQVEQALQAPR
ncbi:MAG: IclR family transcriptional regulator [Frankiaceae bacterium]